MKSLRFGIGLLVGLVGPLAAGELYARYQPPADVNLYLGDRSPLSGPFKPDPKLGADYRSFETLNADYQARFDELNAFRSQRPTWLWFGNSFVQAPGMLGDTAQAAMPDRLMVYLRRNEPLYVRAAQLRLLLARGLKPERIIFVMLPIDSLLSPQRPISSIHVNTTGAITHAPRMPPEPFASVIQNSRLAFLGWVRSGRQNADPSYRPVHSAYRVSPFAADDLERVMSVLAQSARDHRVPITVALLPNREQINGRASFIWQDAVTGIARTNGLDVFDARHVFDGIASKLDIFVPDGHFNPYGNALVLAALRKHLDTASASAAGAKP